MINAYIHDKIQITPKCFMMKHFAELLNGESGIGDGRWLVSSPNPAPSPLCSDYTNYFGDGNDTRRWRPFWYKTIDT